MNEIQTVPGLPQKNVLGLVLKIIGLVILVAAVGGGASLATRIWDPLWNPFRPSPEKVISQMMDKMEQVKTENFALEMTLVGKGLKTKGTMEAAESFDYSFKLNGISDASDPNKFKNDLNFNFSGQIADNKISLIGEVINIDTDLYFILKKIEVPIDLNQIKNQWIKISKETMEKIGAQEQVQKETTEKLQKLFIENKVYYVKEELPDQKIEGENMYHYSLAIDKEKTIKLIPEVVSSFFEAIGEINFDFLIGKKDNLLYQFNLEKEIDVSKFDEKMRGMISVKLNLTQSDFNKPVEVKVPADYTDIEEIFPLENLMPNLMPNLNSIPAF